MPQFNGPVVRRQAVVLVGKLIRTKNPATLIDTTQQQQPPPGTAAAAATTAATPGKAGAAGGKSKLQKCLTTLDLTSLGVGSCVGTGMYLVAGMVAKNIAGPGVVLSFMIAAIASIFSGVCYAEFGVRVPHTTGSAYMYSYVTVGEFLAFVIGWNMVLEYLIGTAACACALSACFDTLSNNAISDTFGYFDVLALLISIFMTLLMVAGVKKSLVFNNILNATNLCIWVFIMTAGLFYVDTKNWSEHGGFMAKGWSGVLTGAATCFYAFIGFDIIATTGEEAHNPKRDIPRAIIISLCIILLAYVSSSLMLTLIVPYDQIDADSALVEMFAQQGSDTCKYIVSVGAMAGLTVSMFGSMFPMPRVVYAMAKDGLIFKFLAQIWPMTGTPAIATCIFGLGAGLAALLIPLRFLVEMMSIGTLLAYTLVSTCVLILRYQPERCTLAEMLPESFKQLEEECGVAPHREGAASPLPPSYEQHVSWGMDDETNLIEEGEHKSEQYLSAEQHSNTYGAVGEAPPEDINKGPSKYREMMARLEIMFPRVFPWRDRSPATDDTGQLVVKLVGLLYLLIVVLDVIVVLDIDYAQGASGFALFLIVLFLVVIISILLFISRKPQNRKTLKFKAPGLPFIPAIAVTVNIYLIFQLSPWTLVRFVVWMTLGLAMYFCYGIKNSLLELEDQQHQNIEMNQQPVDINVGDYDASANAKLENVPYDTAYDQPPAYQHPTSVANPNAYGGGGGWGDNNDPIAATNQGWGDPVADVNSQWGSVR